MSKLHKKYNVTRVDGTPITVPCFVLELHPKMAVWSALEAYAHGAENDDPELAQDLRKEAGRLEDEWADQQGELHPTDRGGHPSQHIRNTPERD